MARFYRTASAAPMDYMYQMNIPLMQQALQANEAGVNMDLQQASAIGDMAGKFNYLTPDSQRAAEISQEYGRQVDEITKAIQKDPMNWKKQKGAIRDLSRNLANNFQTGEISKISANYAKYKELDDYISKREEAGKLSPAEGAAFRAKALESLKDSTSFNPKTGTYNIISTTKPMDTINVRERLSKFVDDMKANEGLEWDTQAGQYFKKTTNGREYISPERIIQTAMQGALGDQELLQYMKQRSDFGLMKGVFDKDGKFISPYTYQPYPLSSVEKEQMNSLQAKINDLKKTNPELASQQQAQLDDRIKQLSERKNLVGNPESALYSPIQSLAGEYSYDKTKSGVDLKNNSLYNQQLNNAFQGQQKALDRAQKDRLFNDKMSQAAQFHKEEMDLKWYLAKNPPAKKGTGTNGVKGKDGKIIPPEKLVETSVGVQDVNPYTENKYFSNEGLSTTLNDNKKKIEDANKKIAEYSKAINDITRGRDANMLTPAERGQVDQLMKPMNELQDRIQNLTADNDYARQWYANSVDFALNGKNESGVPNLTPEEKQLYLAFAGDRDGSKLSQQIKDDAATFPFASTGTVSWLSRKMNDLTGAIKEDDPEYADLYRKRVLLTDYKNVKDKVDRYRNEYLSRAKENTYNKVPSIEFGDADRKELSGILKDKTHGLALYDAYGKADGGLGQLDNKGLFTGESKAAFADGSIQKYLDDNNGEIEVLGVSGPAGFGDNSSGAALRVRFKAKNGKDKSVGDLPTNKDFYVTLDPQTQGTLGLKFANNANPEIAKIGKSLLSSRDQAITNMIIDVRNQTDNQYGDYGVRKQVQLPLGDGSKLPVIVQSYYKGDGDYDYRVLLRKNDGTEIPMRSNSTTGGAGWFDSIDHLIQNLDQNLKDGKFVPE